MSDTARAARLARAERPAPTGAGLGAAPTMAVAGAVDPAPLRAAGWRLRGALQTLPYDDPVDAAAYPDVGELLADEGLDAVAVDGTDPSLAALLPALRRSGLRLLLPSPAPLEPAVLSDAAAVPDEAATAVGLLSRWAPWALTVRAALPLAGGPPVQVTVRGWPRGRDAAAELVDLVAGWCGGVAAAVAAPAPLPAARLPDGEPVAWALLCGSGATVLVSHQGGAARTRLSFADCRLEAGPDGVRWVGGATLPLLPLPAQLPSPRGCVPGLVATAACLARGPGDPPVATGTSRALDPAGLGDLLVAARALAALRESARREQPVAVG